MQNISVAKALRLMDSGLFFSLKDYVKADGSLRSFNARKGVRVHSKGGSWNGNAQKNVLIAEPISIKTKKEAVKAGQSVNPYRTLKIESLIGCELRAQGNIYRIVE